MPAASTSPDRAAGHPGRGAVRTAVVWDYLREALAGLGSELAVLDAGGGSGGFAVPLAEHGHRVTVVDPSPDSLAALERRAAEAGVTDRITGVQGDAAGLADLVTTGSVDVVLCHSVLEVVDDPVDALHGIAAVLRPGGIASVVVASRSAAIVARVASGRLDEARHLLTDPDGVSGPHDPVSRRFDLDELTGLLDDAGLPPRRVHGVRVLSDVVPAALLDTDAQAVADLLDLERAVTERPEFLPLATQLHVLAVRA